MAHALVGKPEFEPTRDGVLEIASHHATQRSMVAALVTYVPIVGIVAVTVNIAIQVHGFRSLGLAIIQNLSLGSLALIVITSLLTYLLPAVAVSMSRITSDKSFSGPVRRGAAQIQVGALVVSSLVLPWISAVLVLVLCYAYWRLRFGTPSPTRSLSIQAWMVQPAPSDSGLRMLWVEGRAALGADGKAPPATANDENFIGLPRTLDQLQPEVNIRVAALREADRPGVAQAVFAALTLALSLYGIQALVSQIQLAPLERVDLMGHQIQAGYIFEAGSGPAIFVPRDMTSATYLIDGVLESREICAPSSSIWAVPFLALASPGAGTGVDCSAETFPKSALRWQS